MKKALFLIFIIIILFVLIITNPTQEDHLSAISDSLKNKTQIPYILDIFDNTFEAGRFASDTLPINYNNYIIFSTMELNDEKISFGIFGYIKTF